MVARLQVAVQVPARRVVEFRARKIVGTYLLRRAPCRWAGKLRYDWFAWCGGCRSRSRSRWLDHRVRRSRDTCHVPPVTSTLPLGGKVAVWLARAVRRLPVKATRSRSPGCKVPRSRDRHYHNLLRRAPCHWIGELRYSFPCGEEAAGGHNCRWLGRSFGARKEFKNFVFSSCAEHLAVGQESRGMVCRAVLRLPV